MAKFINTVADRISGLPTDPHPDKNRNHFSINNLALIGGIALIAIATVGALTALVIFTAPAALPVAAAILATATPLSIGLSLGGCFLLGSIFLLASCYKPKQVSAPSHGSILLVPSANPQRIPHSTSELPHPTIPKVEQTPNQQINSIAPEFFPDLPPSPTELASVAMLPGEAELEAPPEPVFASSAVVEPLETETPPAPTSEPDFEKDQLSAIFKSDLPQPTSISTPPEEIEKEAPPEPVFTSSTIAEPLETETPPASTSGPNFEKDQLSAIFKKYLPPKKYAEAFIEFAKFLDHKLSSQKMGLSKDYYSEKFLLYYNILKSIPYIFHPPFRTAIIEEIATTNELPQLISYHIFINKLWEKDRRIAKIENFHL